MASVSVAPVTSNIMCILSMASLGHTFGTDQKVHVFICDHSYNRITATAYASADFYAMVGGANPGTWLDAIWKNWLNARVSSNINKKGIILFAAVDTSGVSMLSVTWVLPEYVYIPMLHTGRLRLCRQAGLMSSAPTSLDTYSNREVPVVV